MQDKKLEFETLAIKNTTAINSNIRPINPPLYLSSTYLRNPDGSYNDGFLYTRHDNPNRRTLEQSITQLENGAISYAFASGMAAINAVFQALKPGDHVILPDDVYFNIYLLMEAVFIPWGLEVSLCDLSNLEQLKSAIKANTTLIWVETPSNPQLKISDIAAIVELVKSSEIMVAVDNTWATPVLQRPLDLGADISMHSTTKYFGGHSDVLGGCLVLKEENKFAEKIRTIQTLSGAVPAPFDSWLITRGIQSLHLRVMAQTQSAQALATYLEAHPKIEKVHYPGLKSHAQYEIAKQQMQGGFGGMLSVLVKGNAQQTIDVSNRLAHFATATSLGGVESLIEHRKSVEGTASKTPENLLRISLGLENIGDLIADWEEVLQSV